MKTYVLSIPLSLQQYSKKLDVVTLLCKNSWNLIKEPPAREVLLFQKDGIIMDSVNGNVNSYSWQYFAQNNSLIINLAQEQGFLFKLAFSSSEFIILQKDGTPECLILANEKLHEKLNMSELTPHSVERYLEYIQGKKGIDFVQWKQEVKVRKITENNQEEESEIFVPKIDMQNQYNILLQTKQDLLEFKTERTKLLNSLDMDEEYQFLKRDRRKKKKGKLIFLGIGLLILVCLPLSSTINNALVRSCLIFFSILAVVFCFAHIVNTDTRDEQYRSAFLNDFLSQYAHCYKMCGMDPEAERWKDIDDCDIIIDYAIEEIEEQIEELSKDLSGNRKE